MKHNNTIYPLIIISLLLMFFLSGCVTDEINGENISPEVDISDIEIDTGEMIGEDNNLETQEEEINDVGEQEVIDNSEIIRQRVENIRKRHELRDLLVDAESYLEGGQQALGLKTLLDIYRKNPRDGIVVAKIAETYYDMKRFGSALNYYERLPNLQDHQKQKVVRLYFYTQDIESVSGRESIIQKFRELGLSQEEIGYYSISILCSINPDNCKNSFERYIKSIDEIQFKKLNDMKIALNNYANFGLDEDYLLYTYIITEWYKQDIYPLVIHLGKKILEEKKDYKPVLKIIGHSFFELGKYKQAQEILTRFHRIDDSDPGVNYMLGIIHAKNRDAVLANIFLRRALDLGYTPTLNLRRHIAYNFSLIESRHNTLRAMEDLIKKEEDFENTDLSLAIYYHILYQSYDTAIQFSQIGQELYPDDAYFYGYEGWAHREAGNPEAAIEVLQNGLQQIPNNAFLYLQLAFALKETESIQSMRIVLNNLLRLDTEEEYKKIAQRELDLLNK